MSKDIKQAMVEYFSNRKNGAKNKEYSPSEEELDFLSFALLKPGIIFQAKSISIPSKKSDEGVDSETQIETKLVSDISVEELMKKFEETMKGMVSTIVANEDTKTKPKEKPKQESSSGEPASVFELFSTQMESMNNVINQAEEIRSEVMMTPQELATASGLSVEQAKNMLEMSGVTPELHQSARNMEANLTMQAGADSIVGEVMDYFGDSGSPNEKAGLTVQDSGDQKNVPIKSDESGSYASKLNNRKKMPAEVQTSETNLPAQAGSEMSENTVLQQESSNTPDVIVNQPKDPAPAANTQQTSISRNDSSSGNAGVSKGLSSLRSSAQMPAWRSTFG